MLEIKDLCVSYGAIDAVKGISLKVDDGEIVSLIGANGAGKTTTLHTITGLVPAKSGSITYDGHDLLKTHANKIVTLGMAHVPEGRHVFTRMSVQENLEMGAFSLKDQSNLGKDLEMVFDYFPRLKERRRQLAGTLSGGEQQMVAMGRALMSHPKTILMDEPSMGLSPLLSRRFSTSSSLCARAASPCCWSNRTRRWPYPLPIAPMCSKPARSRWKARPRICCTTRRCARHTSARDA